ncbi:hypothetical protein [Cupriavidus basilensis]|nr:hypothetical protein [Cupriavidus basilensis]
MSMAAGNAGSEALEALEALEAPLAGLVRAQDAIRVALPPRPHHKLERV